MAKKGFIAEFKEFIARGNVMDLAVGVIIGGAFQSIVNSLVNDMIMPVISLLTGGVNFSNWVIRIGSGENDTIKYGNFITAVINFLLMALVIFCFVKVMNNLASRTEKLLKKEEEAPAAEAQNRETRVTESVNIRSEASTDSDRIALAYQGDAITQIESYDNGWSKVTFQKKGEDKIIGYVSDSVLSDTEIVNKFTDTVTAAQDSDILDYPGKKDGEVVGEVLQDDELKRTGTVDAIWSRIVYTDDSGSDHVGYIPTSCLEGYQATEVAKAEQEKNTKAGSLTKSSGEGVFADAVDGVTSTGGSGSTAAGVQIGTPVSVSSDATLKPLGTFRITHYCPCSICCGPWANGITSTGVTATTNRTIAVDPSQIPYGSKVVINGQVYVAEDCGGAIRTNCIDVYVATHSEAEQKGVFYTEVYLLQ